MSFRFFRRFCYEIHLCLGIVSGIILFLVCLSGTIYVFREEAQHLAEPAKYYVDVPHGATPLSADALIARTEAAKPGMTVTSITIPEKPNRTVTMILAAAQQNRENRERGAHGGGRVRNTVYVNPYTGDIAGEGANVVDPFFMSMFTLHRYLWFSGEMRRVGKMIVGTATIVFVVVCLTGIVLWLPGTWNACTRWKAWKPGLRIRFKKGPWPFLYDTHNTVGFYLSIPALLLALTGLCWSFSWYRDGASHLLGEPVFKQRMQRPEIIAPLDGTELAATGPFSVAEIIARQNELTPGPGEISVSIPPDKETAMVIQKGRTGFFALAIKDKTHWDRFRGTAIPVEHHGKTVLVERFADKPLGAQMAASIRAIHVGNITGLSSKIFFFIVCLFATSWPITGAALWIKKLRAQSRKRKADREATGQSGTIQAVSQQHQPGDETTPQATQTA